MQPPLILASASPQRSRILRDLGMSFRVSPPTCDESACKETDPVKRASLLAQMKAHDRAAHFPDTFILGCDTLVVAADGTLLEKPKGLGDASMMIQRQSDSCSVVHSALCLLTPEGGEHAGVSSSKVFFKRLSSSDIDWWISTNLWRDRSGSFQIDGLGQLMIERLEGDFPGVVGLPVFLFGQLLKAADLDLKTFSS